MWPKGETIDNVVVIGVIGAQKGGLYKLKGKSDQALVDSTINPSELWHRRFAHLHYRALPIVRKAITHLPEFQVNHDGVCKGCAQGKNVKSSFPNSNNKTNRILDIVHLDVCGPM